jgi:hypothetical protein
VLRRSITAGLVVEVVSDVVGSAVEVDGVPLINLCLSSPSFSSSLSDPSASNVSTRFWFTEAWGLCDMRRELGEESLDRKEGGGDCGTEA